MPLPTPFPQRQAADEQRSEDEQCPAQLGHRERQPLVQTAASRTASSTSTATRRETPGSFMVTPMSCEASSIVVLLCVMKMNCTRSDISFTMSQNRPTLCS